MTVTRLGELSVLDVVPLLAQFQTGLDASLGIALPELNAKLVGLNNVLLAITIAPPALGATIQAAIATVVSLQAAIGGPTVTLQVGAIVALIAELTVSLGTLTAAAALSVPSSVVSAYAYDGPSVNFGSEIQSAIDSSLPGAPAHCNALVLASTDAAAWAGFSLALRTS